MVRIRAALNGRPSPLFPPASSTLLSSAASIGVSSPSATVVAIVAAVLTLSAPCQLVACYRAIFPSRQNSFNTEPQGSCVALLGKFNCFPRQCIGLAVKQTLGSDRCSVGRPSGAAIGISALSRFIGHQFVSSLFYQVGSAGRGLRAPTSAWSSLAISSAPYRQLVPCRTVARW